ncbi:protein transport protein Sec61 subunit gamma-like [Mus musculus]|uniref:protein transport protein Sec61 subunit gamma-like n=1 Tax=Mus musculus TaxID=10090 RepID=UPI00167C42D8|nr:protein transport protein Sec61 subunit gamma-like [Mus musculus]
MNCGRKQSGKGPWEGRGGGAKERGQAVGAEQKNVGGPHPTNLDQVMEFVKPSWQFVKDSVLLVKRCTKPHRREFQKIAMATAIGFAIMGFIGFFEKLIHIPNNNIIVGG